MRDACPDLTRVIVELGHWMAQEQPGGREPSFCRFMADKTPDLLGSSPWAPAGRSPTGKELNMRSHFIRGTVALAVALPMAVSAGAQTGAPSTSAIDAIQDGEAEVNGV